VVTNGEVQPGVAVEHQLVVDDLVGHIRGELRVRDAVPGNALAFERERPGGIETRSKNPERQRV